MTTKARLTKLEKARNAAQKQKIFVYIEGEEYGTVDGVKMTPQDWHAQSGSHDVVINVRNQSLEASENASADQKLTEKKAEKPL